MFVAVVSAGFWFLTISERYWHALHCSPMGQSCRIVPAVGWTSWIFSMDDLIILLTMGFYLFSSSPYGSDFFLVLGHTGNHCCVCGMYLVPISVLKSISFLSLWPPDPHIGLARCLCIISNFKEPMLRLFTYWHCFLFFHHLFLNCFLILCLISC